DSLLIGDKCGAHTVPYIEAKNSAAVFEHEATTSKISEDMLFYCMQRGLSEEEAVALVVNGFVKDVLQQLPMEFAVEAQKLISISLEGSVGCPEGRGTTLWARGTAFSTAFAVRCGRAPISTAGRSRAACMSISPPIATGSRLRSPISFCGPRVWRL